MRKWTHLLMPVVMRWMLAIAFAAFGTVGGLLTYLLGTETGKTVVTSFALERVSDALNGTLSADSAKGSVTSGLQLHGVVVHDDDGVFFARFERILVRYRWIELLRGNIVLSDVVVDGAALDITEGDDGRFNYQRVLRLGEGDGTGGPSPLVAFRNSEVRSTSLTIRTPSGPPGPDERFETERFGGRLVRVRYIDGLAARVPYIRITSPFEGEKGIEVEIEALEASFSDPELDIRGLSGHLNIDGSVLTADVTSLALPGSEASVSGTLQWPEGDLLLDLDIVARRWAMNDVRALVPRLPWGMAGEARLRLRSDEQGALSVRAEGVRLTAPRDGGTLAGTFGAVIDDAGFAFRGTALETANIDIEYIRPLLDTIPLTGRLDGRFVADGTTDEFAMEIDWVFRDSLVAGWPESAVRGTGLVSVRDPSGFDFIGYAVDSANIDLATIRNLFPAVDLLGRIAGSGTLNGPWQDVIFDGHLEHRHDTLPVTVADGQVRLDSRRDTLGVWAALTFDSLRLAGVHPSYPQLPAHGAFAGAADVAGYADSMTVAIDLRGPPGLIRGTARAVLLPELAALYEVDGTMTRLDLERFDPRLPPTEVYGQIGGQLEQDTRSAPRGSFDLVLDTSFVAGAPFDSLRGGFSVADSVFRSRGLRTWARYVRGVMDGRFGLGVARPGDSIATSVEVDSLGAIESLLEEYAPFLGRAATDSLEGRATLEAILWGGTSDFDARLEMSAADILGNDAFATGVGATVRWSSDVDDPVDVRVRVDTLAVAAQSYSGIGLALEGVRRDASWQFRARIGVDASLVSWGRWFDDGEVRTIAIDAGRLLVQRVTDDLDIRESSRVWDLEPVALVSISDAGYNFHNFRFAAESAGAEFELDGLFPRRAAATLTGRISGLPVRDLWAVVQRDPTRVDGELGGRFALGGTVDDPDFEGDLQLARGRAGTVRIPQLQSRFGYERQRLTGTLTLQRLTERVLDISIDLPLNLALRQVQLRRIPGPLTINAIADSVDLAFVEFVTPLVRNAAGRLDANFGVTGSWERPRLTGDLTVAGGTASFPAVGVTHRDLHGRLVLSGDTIRIDTLTLASGAGRASASGYVRLEGLRQPRLQIGIRGDRFGLLDVRDFAAATMSGNIQLRGPVFGATLTGEGTVTDGVLYFADLIEKDIINLEDTVAVFRDLIDQAELEREGLRTEFPNRFFDSLSVDQLRLTMGSSVWLRSSEANVQLDGELLVNKVGSQYRFDGTLSTPRGTYRLPFLGRGVAEFQVTNGQVLYFGTADLNADLNIDARTVVRTVRGDNVTIFVNISGTIEEPELALSSDIEPPLPESELISYLLFRAPSFEALAGAGGSTERSVQLDAMVAAVSGQVFSELERALISDLGVPIDYLQIRPASALGGFAGAEVVVGKQLGERTFFRWSPRYCSAEPYWLDALWPAIDFRYSRSWRLSFSLDPAHPCGSRSRRFGEDLRYQVGADILWEKRY